MTDECSKSLAIVVIGRNEGPRLRRCLESAFAAGGGRTVPVIYVDSASADDSVGQARNLGAEVLELTARSPTAAAARNAGLRHAETGLVFCVDGDTAIDANFLARALPHFQDPLVTAVWGQRHEVRPHRSIYQAVLEVDDLLSVSHHFGGDVILRRQPALQVGAYAADMIAGEDLDLCRRLQQAGQTCRYLPIPMTTHDLGITSWRQYWLRAYRTGYGMGEVAWRAWRDQQPGAWANNRRQLAHGALVASLLAGGFHFAALWWALLLLIGRIAWRHTELPPRLRVAYAIHTELQQIPILVGHLAWAGRKLLGRPARLIEYR